MRQWVITNECPECKTTMVDQTCPECNWASPAAKALKELASITNNVEARMNNRANRTGLYPSAFDWMTQDELNRTHDLQQLLIKEQDTTDEIRERVIRKRALRKRAMEMKGN